MTGDLARSVYQATEADARRDYELYTREVGGFAMPVWSVPGNHDFFAIEPAPGQTGSEHPLRGRALVKSYLGPNYYSFNSGSIHFVALDTVEVAGTTYFGHVDPTQLAWLERDLALLPPDTTVVTFNHIPFFSAGALLDGLIEAPASRSIVEINGRMVFRHVVTNAADVLRVLRTRRHVLALGGHLHLRERLRFEIDGVQTRFEQAAAIVGPRSNANQSLNFRSGVTVYRVTGTDIDEGEFVPLEAKPNEGGGDVRLALRRIRKQPGFAASVIASLGLAIGASAVAFSILDAVRLRALPLPDSDRLVVLSETQIDRDGSTRAGTGCPNGCSVSYVTYSQALARREFRSVGALAAFASGGKALTVGNDTQTVVGTVSSESLFAMLGVQPAIGRLFTAEDNRLGAPPVALLSHGLWVSQFAQDPAVVGRPVQLSDTRYTVVGIMPRGFDFELGSQFWLPETPALDPSTRPSITNVAVVGRLAPNASLEQFRAELASVDLAAVRRPDGAGRRFALTAEPLRSTIRGGDAGSRPAVLRDRRLRADHRVRECDQPAPCARCWRTTRIFDPHRAGRGRIPAGAPDPRRAFHSRGRRSGSRSLRRVAGVADRGIGRPVEFSAAFRHVVPPRPARCGIRHRGRLAGRHRHQHRSDAAGGQRRRATGAARAWCGCGRRQTWGVCATRLRRGATRVRRGAHRRRRPRNAQGVASVTSQPRLRRRARRAVHAKPAARLEGERQVRAADRTHPRRSARRSRRGVSKCSRVRASWQLDHADAVGQHGSFFRRGSCPARWLPSTPSTSRPSRFACCVDAHSRVPTGEHAAPVAIVNQWAADRWWNGKDALGETIRLTASDGNTTTLTVVGVVADNKAGQSGLLLADDGPLLYRPFEQAPSAFASFFVRVNGDPSGIVRPVNQTVARLVPNRPLSTQVVSNVIGQQLGGLRSTAAQLTGIAGAGLFLALIGVHGLLAYNVNRRTRELGIRRVLGATTGSVIALILSDAAKLAALGVTLGLGVAWAGLRWRGPAATDTAARVTARGDPRIGHGTRIAADQAACCLAPPGWCQLAKPRKSECLQVNRCTLISASSPTGTRAAGATGRSSITTCYLLVRIRGNPRPMFRIDPRRSASRDHSSELMSSASKNEIRGYDGW